MNHADDLKSVTDHAWSALSCHSTPAEMGPYVTAEQARILLDASDQLREIALARPAIKPAQSWRTPTEVRLAVASNLKARSDQGVRRNKHGRVLTR